MSSQTLDNQRGTPGPAGGWGPGPSLGAAYLSPPDPPCQPGPQREREREECELEKKREIVKEKVLTESWRG